jgi:hypothetical protein
VCENHETTLRAKTKLQIPNHLTTPMGQVYVKTLSEESPIGDGSFHFDKYYPYIDYTNDTRDY